MSVSVWSLSTLSSDTRPTPKPGSHMNDWSSTLPSANRPPRTTWNRRGHRTRRPPPSSPRSAAAQQCCRPAEYERRALFFIFRTRPWPHTTATATGLDPPPRHHRRPGHCGKPSRGGSCRQRFRFRRLPSSSPLTSPRISGQRRIPLGIPRIEITILLRSMMRGNININGSPAPARPRHTRTDSVHPDQTGPKSPHADAWRHALPPQPSRTPDGRCYLVQGHGRLLTLSGPRQVGNELELVASKLRRQQARENPPIHLCERQIIAWEEEGCAVPSPS